MGTDRGRADRTGRRQFRARVPPHLWDDPPMSVERWETGGDWGMDALPHNENLAGRPGFQQRSPRRPAMGLSRLLPVLWARWPPYWSD